MPIETAESFIPNGNDMIQAFSVVCARHVTIGKTLKEIMSHPFQEVGKVAGDYFTAGVAYLANRGHDSSIQEIGTTTWWAVNQRQVQTALVDDMPGTAMRLGVPPLVARTSYANDEEPHVIFTAKRSGAQTVESAFVLLPPHFIVMVQNKPIEAMATMSWICSQVKDQANGRLIIDRANIIPRAIATEAHFLREALNRYPNLQLATQYQKTLTRYPQGLDSLPAAMRYNGISGTEFRSAPNN